MFVNSCFWQWEYIEALTEKSVCTWSLWCASLGTFATLRVSSSGSPSALPTMLCRRCCTRCCTFCVNTSRAAASSAAKLRPVPWESSSAACGQERATVAFVMKLKRKEMSSRQLAFYLGHFVRERVRHWKLFARSIIMSDIFHNFFNVLVAVLSSFSAFSSRNVLSYCIIQTDRKTDK